VSHEDHVAKVVRHDEVDDRLRAGRVIDAPIGIAPVAGDGRGVHDVTAVVQMRGDLVPARAVMPGAVDEHECQHGTRRRKPSPHQDGMRWR
jgi:hypothetical protein